jgi:hypothetical protein
VLHSWTYADTDVSRNVVEGGMRWTADQTVSSIIQQKPLELEPAGSGSPGELTGSASVGGHVEGTALIDWIEPASSVAADKILIDSRNRQVAVRVAAELKLRITKLLRDPNGLPDGKGKRTRLSRDKECTLRSGLTEAFEYAALFAAKGPLPNRTKGLGRPPDNAVFIFIDDIIHACKAVGLKPGLRYIKPKSLPVLIYIELAPLLWPGRPKDPRRLFERWQRSRTTLDRL